MHAVIKVAAVLSCLALMAGCATRPTCLTPEVAGRVRTVAVMDEINVPTTFTEQVPANVGVLVAAVAQAIVKDKLTQAVEENLDYRQFTRDALKASFVEAIKRHPGWSYVEGGALAKADAAFVLDVSNIGLGQSRFGLRYPPTITFSATLIANPPFEIARAGQSIQALDPVKHPTLYSHSERVQDGFFFPTKELPGLKYYEYTGDPDAFKKAFQAAIDLGMKQMEASWQTK